MYLLHKKWLRSPPSTPSDVVFSKGLMVTSIKIPDLKVLGSQNFLSPGTFYSRGPTFKNNYRVQPSKKHKGKKADQPLGRLEDNVLDRTFPYPEFMDKSQVTPAVLDKIGDDPDDFVDRFQWASCMLLKVTIILRCSEPVLSASVQASRDVKDLRESIRLLKVKKLALEEAKEKLTSELGEFKEVPLSEDRRLEEKDHELEKARSRISKLEKSNAKSSDEIA